ncbi:MAG: DNA primase [Saprospirales bacterium]|nr:DNA primase [Saprospirales bacterium]MBK8351931.1 DNA primase [Saprospirales bacterium]
MTVPRPSPDGKRKVIVDYKNVPDEVLGLLSEKYPHGYNKGIIKFTNAKKELVSAVPIDLGDTTYLVKVSTQLQKMVNDYDDDELFPEVVAPTEKEIPIGAGGDFDDFDKSDEDDGGKRKAKGRVKSADDLEYGFDDEDDDDGDDDDDDDEAASDDDGDDDDE